MKEKKTSAYEEHAQSYYDDDEDDQKDFGKDDADLDLDLKTPEGYDGENDDDENYDDYVEDENCPEECFCEESFVDCQDLEISVIPGIFGYFLAANEEPLMGPAIFKLSFFYLTIREKTAVNRKI